MSISQAFIQELEQEAQTTRRVLERVPSDHLAWKPHAKSMSLGQLALHVATTPGEVAQMATQSEVQVPDFGRPEAKTTAELFSALDDSVATAKSTLEGLDDPAMGETWRAMAGDQEVMALPRVALLRSAQPRRSCSTTGITTADNSRSISDSSMCRCRQSTDPAPTRTRFRSK